jgi:XTP/dITP diphosphohydrolase
MSALKRGDTIVFATHNAAKIRELDEMLAPFRMTVASAGALGLPEPEETGLTFEENAIIKAVAAATASGKPALADDSGIAVDALGGDPGIYSARWAGPNKDFAHAMQTIENELQKAGATTPDKRTARFIAVLCLAFPDGSTETFRGEVEGTLVWPPRGPNGFGYDPMFAPRQEARSAPRVSPEASPRTGSGATGSNQFHNRTFGEMGAHEKARLSHRARAFAAFAHAVLK